MSDVLKDAIRDLKEDLDRLHGDLANEIVSIVGHDQYLEDEIITEEDGKVSVDVAELKALFERLDDASGEANSAFQTFDREVERVWRRFRQTLVQHSEVTP
jgi:hypothetical protein